MKKVVATLRILLGLFILTVNILLGMDIFMKVELNGYGIIAITIGSIIFLYTSAYLIYSGIAYLFNKPKKRLFIKTGLIFYFLLLFGLASTWLFNYKVDVELLVFHIVFTFVLTWLGIDEWRELRIKN